MPKFYEEAKKVAYRIYGAETPDEQVGNAFALFGPARRFEILQELDKEIQNADGNNIREMAELNGVQRRWETEHQMLLKAGR